MRLSTCTSITKMITLLLMLALIAISNVIAQTPTQGTKSKPSDLKILSFGYEPKSSTRLEEVQVSTNPALYPTGTEPYSAQFGGSPRKGDQYLQYVRQQSQNQYAVLRVRNDSQLTIKSIEWEFTHPRFKGEKEIVFRQTTSRLKIPAGQTAVLSQLVPDDRCQTRMSAQGGAMFLSRTCGRTNPRTTSFYPLEARIKKVTYTNGTSWESQP